MPLVAIPGVGDVEFPDTMSTADISAAAGKLHTSTTYEGQLRDNGLTEQSDRENRVRTEIKADLAARMKQARTEGDRSERVINALDFTERNVVEPLTRPLSGAVGRAVDAVVPIGAEERLQQPLVNLPRMDRVGMAGPSGQITDTGGQIAAGAYNGIADLVGSLSSPDALALLPAAANKTVLTAWIAQMAGHQPERVLKATSLFQAGKTQEAVQEVTAGLGELGLAEMGRRHVMSAGRPTAADVEGQPRLNINERGEVVDLPNPDLVARNIASPGTLRPQEQVAWARPEIERPADMVQFERTPIFNRAGDVVDVQIKPVEIAGRRLFLPVRDAAGNITGVRPQVTFPDLARTIEPAPERGNVRTAPETGRLDVGGQEFRSRAETPGFLQTAEQRLSGRPDPARWVESSPEAAPAIPLRDVEGRIRQMLEQRDMLNAIEALAGLPAEVSGKLVNDLVGVGRKRVPLSAAETTIFNEVWDKVYQESLRRETPPPSAPGEGGPGGRPPGPGPAPGGGLVNVGDALVEAVDAFNQRRAAAKESPPATITGSNARQGAEMPAEVGATPPRKETFQEMIARRAAERDVIINKNLTEAGTAGGVVMQSQSRPGVKLLISPDIAEPGKWRTTQFDEQGPVSHHVFNDRDAAIRAASGEHHTKKVGGPSYYKLGEFAVTSDNSLPAGRTEPRLTPAPEVGAGTVGSPIPIPEAPVRPSSPPDAGRMDAPLPEARAEVDSSRSATAAGTTPRSGSRSSPAASSSAPAAPELRTRPELEAALEKVQAERKRSVAKPRRTPNQVLDGQIAARAFDVQIEGLQAAIKQAKQAEADQAAAAQSIKDAQENARLDELNARNRPALDALSENQLSQLAIELGQRPARATRQSIFDNTHPDDVAAALARVTAPKPKPVSTPAKAVAKVKAEVESVARTEGQRPAKEVKSELVQRLEAAIAEAPTEAEFAAVERPKDMLPSEWKKSRQLTIQIPGDGTFTIFNHQGALAEVLKRAEKLTVAAGGSKRPAVRGPRNMGPETGAAKAIEMYGNAEQAIETLTRQRRSLVENAEDVAQVDATLKELWRQFSNNRHELPAKVRALEAQLKSNKDILASEVSERSQLSWTVGKQAVYAQRRQTAAARVAELEPQIQQARADAEQFNARYDQLDARTNELLKPPEPGLVSHTPIEAWADRTIAESKKRVNTGVDPELVAAYLTKGIAVLERMGKAGAKDFATWARKMIAEHGPEIRPHLRSVFEEATRTLSMLRADGMKMRSVSRRGVESEQLPASARAKLATDPASFYRMQKPKNVEDAAALMSNTELRQPLDLRKQGDEQNYVARQLELSRRLMAEAATEAEGYAVFQQLSEAGTAMGQLINQFKLLRNQTPDGILTVVRRSLMQAGAPDLTPGQSVQLRVLAGEQLKAVTRWRAAEEAWAADPSRANLEKVIKAKAEVEAAGQVFNERVQRIVPRPFWDVMTALLVGNKFSMLSQERNVVYNTMMMPVNGLVRLGAAPLDMLHALVTGKRDLALRPQSGLSGAGAAAWNSLPEVARVMLRGKADAALFRGESNTNLRPWVAFKEILAGELLRNKPLAQKLALLVEASPPAYFAAGMFRGLSGLDIPSREAARGRLIAEELTLMKRRGELGKVTNQMIRDAVRVPELFLSPEAVVRVNREALGAVFQEPNAVARTILGIEKQMPGPLRFGLRGLFPVLGIPIRLASQAIQFSPFGLAYAARHALKGDARAAKLSLSRAMIGSIIWGGVGPLLYDQGLIGPPLDAADEQQKQRLAKGAFLPPNHINVSGLKRLFSGDSPAWRAGDETKDISFYGAILGGQLQIYSAMRRMAEKQPVPESRFAEVSQWLANAMPAGMNYLVNQTFMEGAREALDALKSERKLETFIANYAGSLADTALPRQMDAITRATRDYAREVKDDQLDKRIQNMIANRLGAFTTAADKLPFKRDLWGRPLRETPEGSNPWVYQVFDVGRSRQMPDDPMMLSIYNLARRTGDARALPTPPTADMEVLGRKYRLNAAQKSELEELVGQNRRTIADRAITARFLSSPDEGQLAALESIWRLGAEMGRLQFFTRNRADLAPAPAPAGYRGR